jgi:hypothetical protein
VQLWVKRGVLRVHTNTLKPFLTEENKVRRVLFALSWRNPSSPNVFQDMADVVHLDEKWFYVTQDGE